MVMLFGAKNTLISSFWVTKRQPHTSHSWRNTQFAKILSAAFFIGQNTHLKVSPNITEPGSNTQSTHDYINTLVPVNRETLEETLNFKTEPPFMFVRQSVFMTIFSSIFQLSVLDLEQKTDVIKCKSTKTKNSLAQKSGSWRELQSQPSHLDQINNASCSYLQQEETSHTHTHTHTRALGTVQSTVSNRSRSKLLSSTALSSNLRPAGFKKRISVFFHLHPLFWVSLCVFHVTPLYFTILLQSVI